jgi:hypothetical protein
MRLLGAHTIAALQRRLAREDSQFVSARTVSKIVLESENAERQTIWDVVFIGGALARPILEGSCRQLKGPRRSAAVPKEKP